MATALQDLEAFRQFVQNRLSLGDADPSLDELFDLWRQAYPSEALHSASVVAIAASIEDFQRGERGTIAGDHSTELRRELGLSEQ